MRLHRWWPLALLPACAAGAGAPKSTGFGEHGRSGPVQCKAASAEEHEVVEAVSTHGVQPSIRRVFRLVGQGALRRRILVCREADTNLDGKIDLVREYDERGEPLLERADADYDGRYETTVRFTRGRISEIAIDADADGKPEQVRSYLRGRLTRIQRDTNQDGKPDVWEIYRSGRLDRMGVDLDADGRVDRWSRDSTARRRADADTRAAPPETRASEELQDDAE